MLQRVQRNQRRFRILGIGIPLLTGAGSAWLSSEGMKTFAMLQKPPLSPPGWLFPVVWTMLYLGMGLASVWVAETTSKKQTVQNALWLYGVQLGVNFFWSIFFFRYSLYLFSFFWLLLLWWLVLVTMVWFYRVKPRAGRLLLPYLLWITFAGYLNFGIWVLNA